MYQPLPHTNFRFDKDIKMKETFNQPENGAIGYFIEIASKIIEEKKRKQNSKFAILTGNFSSTLIQYLFE